MNIIQKLFVSTVVALCTFYSYDFKYARIIKIVNDISVGDRRRVRKKCSKQIHNLPTILSVIYNHFNGHKFLCFYDENYCEDLEALGIYEILECINSNCYELWNLFHLRYGGMKCIEGEMKKCD